LRVEDFWKYEIEESPEFWKIVLGSVCRISTSILLEMQKENDNLLEEEYQSK
jgi:hypothetical protein